MLALFCGSSEFNKCLSCCKFLNLCIFTFLIFHFISIDASRFHHLRHERQRHRRQFYFPQNITIGLNSSPRESGPWGKWTQSSECSRSCGGGVAYQTRICLDMNRLDEGHSCVGPSKRYYSCNVQDCPDDTKDFREEQCTRFDSLAFEGKYYSWIPYTKGSNPCELNCMPKGERFYYRHARKVIDGTRCYEDGSLDVCVDGICMPVGCDKMLGSNVKEDKCRICGGDGSTCRTVEGVYDSDHLEVGYNDILVIPAGATNIKIAERIATNNYLAVRNSNGEFYLNGNWRIQFPGEFKFAGTSWSYQRKVHGILSPETLFGIGPITESILIVLLKQERNLGIAYEYSVPIDVRSSTALSTYSWVFGDFGQCSRSCGTGVQKRRVYCSRTRDQQQVDDTLCDINLRPIDNRTCNPEPCPAAWFIGEWSNCSCHHAVQHRLVYCKLGNDNGNDIIASDSECEENDRKPPTVQSCIPLPSCAVWKVGEWDKCGKYYCGEGQHRREVNCTFDDEIVDESLCNHETRPKEMEDCNVPCEGVEWVIGEWSSCDVKCGSQIQTRSVVCSSENGNVFSNEHCDQSKVHETQRLCTELPPCDALWHTSEWSACNVKCGQGLQTRNVFCGHLKGNQFVFSEESNCINKKPQNVSICKQSKCEGSWFTAPWERCSVPCGGGQRIRKVFCIDSQNEIVPDDQCDSSQKPLTNQDCNTNECDDDLLISTVDGCKNSEFGCCPDGNTTAGENYKGCPLIEALDGCQSTTYGCCRDLQTVAFGPFEKGCPINCNFTKYGCCLDGLTPANSSDFDVGCPKFEECELSPYGCCLDGTTIASGPNFEGCIVTTTTIATTTLETTTAAPTTTTTTTPTTTTTIKNNKINSTEKEDKPTEFSLLKECTIEGSGEGSGEDCEEGVQSRVSSKEPKCSTSKFGCCPDGITPATGNNFEGCEEASGDIDFNATAIAPSENCNLTEFGCCPDGKTRATGPRYYGCTCEQFPHGCCQDRYTPARGPNYDGCVCSRMLYGCCSDGVTPKTGPNLEGCNCESSTYGCCPDMVNTAGGPNFAGCPCDSLQYGCCPGSSIPAKGPNFEGCSCASTPFGCCPDGNTVAYGPKFEGCPSGPSLDTKLATEVCGLPKERGSCRNFTVKWYFDIHYGGCNRFWYGGCEGNGNRFSSQEQCELACVLPEGPERCSLPKIPGPCNSSHVAWYFNTETRNCQEFLYGGCLGNTNRFPSRQICEQHCIHLETSLDRCEQPPTAGPCRGAFTRWYYSKEHGRCRQFIYGGCRGNSNNFETESECRHACATHSPFEICSLAKAEGPCLGNFPRWYFDYSYGVCREFTYTGCSGNKNRFVDKVACEKLCNQTKTTISIPAINIPICSLPKSEGPCRNPQIKWYYNSETQRCERFYYGGCEGNSNRFDDRETCERNCIAPVQERNICVLAKEPGNCYEYTERWYYEQDDRRCHRFYYSGCGGNENNFATFHECNQRCGAQVFTSTEPSIHEFRSEFCFKPYDSGPCHNMENRWYYDRSDGVCKEFIYGGCEGNENRFKTRHECETKCWNSQDICKLSRVRGPCSGTFTQWYYDNSINECLEFLFSGCHGNANRFNTKESCEAQCKSTRAFPIGVVPAQDSCQLPYDQGPCRGFFPKYYYSSLDNTCKHFIYGGCDGNLNRFDTRNECENKCRQTYKEEEITENDSVEVVCRHANDPGQCTESLGRWFYDPSSQTCLPFVYSGCGGNKNRFRSYDICMKICSGVYIRPTQPPHPVHTPSYPDYRPPERVECAPSNCDRQRCPYGIDEFVDERGCSSCRCSNPCYAYQCPEDMACSVEAYRAEDGTPKAQAVCRLKVKPGQCPSSIQDMNNVATDCIDRCRTDADCRDNDKCCNNGCANVCVYPEGKELISWTNGSTPKVIFPYEPYPGGSRRDPFEETEIIARVGTDVVLDCSKSDDQGKHASWSKDGHPLLSNEKLQLLANGSLKISTVESENAGTYACSIEKGKTKYTKVVVQAPARILPGPQVVIAQIGFPAHLQCNAVGNPDPTVTWWKDQQMLPLQSMQYRQYSNFTLLIRRAGDKDGGLYTCQAYNGIGSIALWDVTLLLDFKMPEPEIRPYEPSSFNATIIRHPNEYDISGGGNGTIVVGMRPSYLPAITHTNRSLEPVSAEIRIASPEYTIGSTLQLECIVRGSQADVAWFFNSDVPLVTDYRHYRILPNNTLIIYSLSASDSGEYKCIAQNQHNSASASVPIKVESTYVPPNCDDSPNFANCDLIVKSKYCNNKHYAKFCCRSCLIAGQIDKAGLA